MVLYNFITFIISRTYQLTRKILLRPKLEVRLSAQKRTISALHSRNHMNVCVGSCDFVSVVVRLTEQS